MKKTFSGLSMLVVDDSRVMRRIIRRFLENAGAKTVLEASRAKAALEMIAGDAPDLIVADLNMPGMDGMALLEAVRAGDNGRDICFVILTVEAVQQTMNRALALGADSYIVKPVGEEVFLEEIRAALRRRASLISSGRT